MCHFFSSSRELVDGLVPYFEAGIDRNERCIWVAAAPLPAGDVESAVAKSPKLKRGAAIGQLTVHHAIDWFGEPAELNAEQIIRRWFSEEERALADGFGGLRITGNSAFIPHGHWSGLMDYERLLHERLPERRIIACCSYDRQQCGSVEIMEVVNCHHGALDRTDQRWEFFLGSPNVDAR